MTPNRSTAVMQRRAATAPDELDYYPTPPWAVRALCEFLRAYGRPMHYAWEPACGEMHMVNPLREYFHQCYGTDVYRYNDQHQLHDFLYDPPIAKNIDWIPPGTRAALERPGDYPDYSHLFPTKEGPLL